MTPSIAIPRAADLRRVPMKSLRASLGAMASRGEVSGPRVDATRAALEWQRNRATLLSMGLTEAEAEDLADEIDKRTDDAQAETAETAEAAVAR